LESQTIDNCESLLSFLERGRIDKTRVYEWAFTDIEVIELENEKFICGNLVKYKEELYEDVVDEIVHKTHLTTIENGVIAKSLFFLHCESLVIAYHPSYNDIIPETFRSEFGKLIEINNTEFVYSCLLEVISDEKKIIEAIKKFEVISKLEIKLKPSNIQIRGLCKETDEKIKAMNANEYKQVYKSDKGLVIKESSQPYKEIIMAVVGYGKAKIIGIKDEIEDEASTEKLPITVKVEGTSDRHFILKILYNQFEEIWWQGDSITKLT